MGIQKNIILRQPLLQEKNPWLPYYYLHFFGLKKNKKETTDFQIIRNWNKLLSAVYSQFFVSYYWDFFFFGKKKKHCEKKLSVNEFNNQYCRLWNYILILNFLPEKLQKTFTAYISSLYKLWLEKFWNKKTLSNEVPKSLVCSF